MSLLDTVLSAGGGDVVKQFAGQFGINSEQATSTISALLPALAAGMKEKLAAGDGSGLSQLISGGNLGKFADDPSSLGTSEAIDKGKSFVNQIFGSQDLSSMIAAVAEKVGLSTSVISNLVPAAAALLGGILSKHSATGGDLNDVIGQIASSGHAGIIDTVKTMAAKIFG
jgi:hypothetical protein